MIGQTIKKLSPRAEFALVGTICFGYFAAGSIYMLLSGLRPEDLSTGRVILSLAIELLILALFALVLRLRGKSFASLSGPPSGGTLLAGIPLYALNLLAFYTITALVFAFYPHAAERSEFTFKITAPAAVMLVFIIVNSFLEELAVTGYVITALESDGAFFAITVSTLIRFIYHLYQGPIASISILPMGLLFGAVYWRTRNLWPLFVAHTIANIVAFAAQQGS